MSCGRCAEREYKKPQKPKKRSRLYYFCCVSNDFEGQEDEEPYRDVSRAYISSNQPLPTNHDQCICQPTITSMPGTVTKLDVISDPSEPRIFPGYREAPPTVNNYPSNEFYPGTKVYVNSSGADCGGRVTTTSSAKPIFYPQAVERGGESRIRLNAPNVADRGMSAGGYIDARQASNVIRFG